MVDRDERLFGLVCSVSVPGHLQRVNAKETLIRLLNMTDVPARRLMSMEIVMGEL